MRKNGRRSLMLFGIYMIVFSLLFLSAWVPSAFSEITDALRPGSQISNLKISCRLQPDGTAKLTETWDMKFEKGTEAYKTFDNMRQKELDITSVYVDGKKCRENKSWNIKNSRQKKAGTWGFSESESGTGTDLCVGPGNYGHHVIRMNYTLTRFINRYKDAQAINYTFFGDMSIPVNRADIRVGEDGRSLAGNTTRIWGFGYKGKCHFNGDDIVMTAKRSSNIKRMQLLAKLGDRTYLSNDLSFEDQSWESIKQDAIYNSDYDSSSSSSSESSSRNESGSAVLSVMSVLSCLLPVLFVCLGIKIIRLAANPYRFESKKKVKLKDVANFRDIPDISIGEAYYLADLMGIAGTEGDLMAAYVLKWLRNGLIDIREGGDIIFVGHERELNDESERRLFRMLVEAAGENGVLSKGGFKKYCRFSSHKIYAFNAFSSGNAVKGIRKKGFKVTEKNKVIYNGSRYSSAVLDDRLKPEMEKIAGIKKFLEDQNNMGDKKVAEVMLWEEYLIFASIFGIADKVAQQLKALHPDYMTPETNYGSYFMVSHAVSEMMRTGVKSANMTSSARNAHGGASSFSGGGSGSSGGGGGGVR